MIAKPVHARRGNQRRDASEQLSGREQKEERPGAGALHAVDEPAVLPLREALESERRPEHVASQPFSAFAIVLVDPDPGVKGEALEEGAAADVGERVRIPEPPVHLGGLESGQCLVLGLLLVGGENLGCPPNDATEDGLHVLILRRWDGHEASGAVLVELEDPVRRQSVEMDVEVDGASRALDRGDAAGPRIDHPQAPCAPSLVGEDGAGEHVEQARGERWLAIPIVSPEAVLGWQALLGVGPARLERNWDQPLPQHFAD